MNAGRILHCIPTMSGGGAERQLAYLAGELERLGWRVHVAVMRRGPNWSRLEASGATIHELPAGSAYDPSLLKRLRGVVATVRPDLIQTWLLQMEVLGGMTALTSGTPWIFSERSSAGAYPRTLKNLVRQGLARWSAAIVSNSNGGDEYWQARVSGQVRRYVVPNGIPLAEIDAALPADLAPLGLRADLPLVLFAGRFEAEKNLETLLPALEIVMAHLPVQLVCCGEGGRRAMIEEWIQARGFQDRVKILGYVGNLWGLMKSAAVIVSPSIFEGSPNVVLEAMASGAPIVASDIPQHRELLDDESARLVPPRSGSDLARAVEDVLRDRASACARATVARRRASEYALPAIARRYADIYADVLSERKK